ncbi:MAG: hypothetical protein ACE5K2_01925 [Candidatus Zixiibacteriota bacterium]
MSKKVKLPSASNLTIPGRMVSARGKSTPGRKDFLPQFFYRLFAKFFNPPKLCPHEIFNEVTENSLVRHGRLIHDALW